MNATGHAGMGKRNAKKKKKAPTTVFTKAHTLTHIQKKKATK